MMEKPSYRYAIRSDLPVPNHSTGPRGSKNSKYNLHLLISEHDYVEVQNPNMRALKAAVHMHSKRHGGKFSIRQKTADTVMIFRE